MVLANRRPSECVFMQSGDDVKSEPTCLVEPLKVRVDETLQQTCVGQADHRFTFLPLGSRRHVDIIFG